MKKSYPSQKPIPQANGLGGTDLHDEARFGDTSRIQLYAKNGFDLDVKDIDGRTPLHIAILQNHIAFANMIIVSGASTNIQDKQGKTPLHVAIEKNYIDLAVMLVALGANMKIADNRKYIPLDYANNPSKLKPLLKSAQATYKRYATAQVTAEIKKQIKQAELDDAIARAKQEEEGVRAKQEKREKSTVSKDEKEPKSARFSDKMKQLVRSKSKETADTEEPKKPLTSKLSALSEYNVNTSREFIIYYQINHGGMTEEEAQKYAETVVPKNAKNIKIDTIIGLEGETFLFKAIRHGKMGDIEALVNLGADTELQNSDGLTPKDLMFALRGVDAMNTFTQYKIDAKTYMKKYQVKRFSPVEEDVGTRKSYPQAGYSHNPEAHRYMEESETADIKSPGSSSLHADRIAQERAEREAMEKRMKESPPQGGFRK